MGVKYKEFSKLDLPEIERNIFKKWQKENAFEKSVSLREGKTPFVFYEGPPSANGLPGIHHVISRTLKDLICRYKTMKGFQVKRKGGWDTHGLPVELGVEKELGITKEDIGTKISIEDYNQKCREAVLRYKSQWDELTEIMGYWVDLNSPYITFDNNYIETLWWLLKSLYEKGLLYESISIQPYSPAAGTGLSSHELNQPGTYKNVKDTSAVVMFKAKEDEKSRFLFEVAKGGVYFLAWTTTPWTLPSNLGLTVGQHIEYCLIKTFNPYTRVPVNVVIAKSLIARYLKAEAENTGFDSFSPEEKLIPWKVLLTFKGKDLEGIYYEQLLPYEANSLKSIREITPDADPFKIVTGDFVTTEDGTGIVHTAPAFGADDFKVGQKNHLGILTLVDREGKFLDGLGPFSNRFVKNYKNDPNYEDVNVDISVTLKKDNKAFKIEKYEHSYPHCWRTDKPILYYPLEAWFIKTTAAKERMVELNKTINWKPKSTGEGRFGNWLENMVDWNLSRSRFWGTPLPIWRTDDASEEICIGSVSELNAEMKKAAEILGEGINKEFLKRELDLHKPFVDEIILVSQSGKPMKRVPDLIDVWFDSGAMPYAQLHYPFENKEAIDERKAFPADFIAEGVDQTRGWFYTLHAIAVMLFDSVAYKTCVSNGLVLDKNGIKMSKRLGNVVNPFDTIRNFGADATRWYLITNASPWENLKFDIKGIQEVQRKFFGTLYNMYQFFSLYANVDEFTFSEERIPLADRPEIDRWILSSLNSLIQKVTDAMDEYEPTIAGRAIETFIDEQLSNWYVRLCRRRFWKGEYERDKIAAYQTLYECLEKTVQMIAPVAPFFSDAIFENLNEITKRIDAASVHHSNFPVADLSAIDLELEERMQIAQEASSLILSLRKKLGIKVRQPLQKVLIPVSSDLMESRLKKVEDLIKAEVNVKEINYLREEESFIHKRIKPNFKVLGSRMGSKMKLLTIALSEFTQEEIAKIDKEGEITVDLDGFPVVLTLGDVEIFAEDIPGWSVASKGTLTVALDTTLTDELKNEGNARELINRIQNIRKDRDFNLTDRIQVEIQQNDSINESINEYMNYICAEILADSLSLKPEIEDGTDIEVNDILLKVRVNKNA